MAVKESKAAKTERKKRTGRAKTVARKTGKNTMSVFIKTFDGETVEVPVRMDLWLPIFLRTGNARKACERIGIPEEHAFIVASQLLRTKYAQEALTFWHEAQGISVRHSLTKLEEQVRADYTQFIRDDGTVDLKGLREAGLDHLIKSVTPTREGVKVEFYDAQKAMEMYFRVQGIGQPRGKSTAIMFRNDLGEWEKEAQEEPDEKIVVYLPDNGRNGNRQE